MLRTYTSGPIVATVSPVSHPTEQWAGLCVAIDGNEHYFKASDLSDYGRGVYRGALVEATARTGHGRFSASAKRDMFGFVMWSELPSHGSAVV